MADPTITVIRRNRVFQWAAGPHARITRLREERGQIHGELAIGVNVLGETMHLHEASINLSSTRARTDWIKRLLTQSPEYDWVNVIEIVCVRSIRGFREGKPSVWLDQVEFTEAIPPRLAPFIYQRQPTVLFGDGGSGKSTISLTIAVCVAAGIQLFYNYPIQCSVLYLDWESDEETMSRRVAKLKNGLNINEHIPLRYKRMNGLLADQIDELATEIAENDYKLVIVDAMAKATANAPEGATSALTMFDAMDSLEVDYLIIDHIDKASLRPGQGNGKPYGSIFKFNSARSVWFASTQGEPGESEIYVKLEQTKANDMTRSKPLPLRIQFGEDSTTIERVGWNDMPEDLQAKKKAGDQIIEVLTHGALTIKEIAIKTGLTEPTAKTTLYRLLNKGFVVQLEGHNWGLVTNTVTK